MRSKEKRKAKIVSLLLEKDMKWNEIKEVTGSPKSTLHGDLEDLKSEQLIKKINKDSETTYSVLEDNIEDHNYLKDYGGEIIPVLKTQSEIIDWLNSNSKLTIDKLVKHANSYKEYYNIKEELESPLSINEIINILRKIDKISQNVGEELDTKYLDLEINGEFRDILEKNEFQLECAKNLDHDAHLN